MPDRCFRKLICGPSGSGKINSLPLMIMNLLYFDKCYLYAKNLEQSKYEYLMKALKPVSKEVGYDILEVSNDEIQPVSEINGNNQKLLIFHDFVCEKNQVLLINYFIRGRHKNCSVIYLSQSYYKTPKDIRLNCSNFCIYEFPSANEKSLLCRENNVDKKNCMKKLLMIRIVYCILTNHENFPLKILMRNYKILMYLYYICLIQTEY